ncbi:hypothetical protein LUZ63_007401 [Rhynchospora breviuscula]|uniref:Uncharacterized protein n=1 Tax=Rhynchospora breviuscula TaxID=2022672 RepID=A0A9Q0CRL8_9POAL|nr:hypothetical protein LUZ63_007401 [Rhynchospora breviuscula]
MRRQGQFPDAGPNPMMQQQLAYTHQQLSGSAYSTQDPLRPADGPKISSYPTMSFTEGQGNAAPHSYMYEAQRGDPKHGTEKMGSTEPKVETANNSALEGNYKDNGAPPQTIDALEQIFFHDLTKLLKEHHDAEDAEFSRHCQRLNEINAQFQEKLVALRANQGKIREEFLKKEAQSRFQQYQQYQQNNSMALYQNNNPPPPRPSGAHHSHPSAGGYGMEGTQRPAFRGAYGAEGYPGGYGGDAPLPGPYPNQASRYESGGHMHGRGFEPHYPGGYPGGRGYSAGGRQH